MTVEDLNGILHGNVVFRKYNEETEYFETVHSFESYNLEPRPEWLMEMEVVSIGLAEIGEYDGEPFWENFDNGLIVVEVV